MTESRIEDAEDIEAEIRKNPMTGTKPHSTPLTLKWLEDNYETSDGVCIPRSTLYLHYLEFCQERDCNPVNAASFGKIIRQQFPQITTRRLGTRGQSKYHYYGIAVKESSPYYDVIYSAKGVQSSSEGKKENTKQLVAYSPRSKLGTLLPPFPDIQDMNVPEEMNQDKVMTFLVMYRTHCQRILDTVIRANFDEVENFLHHFWQGMPSHMTPILATPLLTTVIALCDSILYKTLCEVLMPSVIQPLPESLTQVIGQFADHIDRWVDQAMVGVNTTLKDTKLDLARQFSQTLRRQLSVNHLVQATRNVLTSSDVIAQMLSDWLTLDLSSIAQQTLYTMEMADNDKDRDYSILWNICTDMEKLLENQSPMESYIDWLEDMMDSWVAKNPFNTSQGCPTTTTIQTQTHPQTTTRQFLLLWTCFSSRVIRDMTIQSVPSFGSFHLLHLMLDDYVLYRIQCLNADGRRERYRRAITGQLNEEDVKPEVILPDTSQVTLPLEPFITPSSYNGNFLHRELFPESLFDYGSSSEFCTSEEDEDDDDDDDNNDDERVDDDKLFIPSSPFDEFKDNSLLNQQHHSRKYFSQSPSQQNSKTTIANHHETRQQQQLPPHHHHHHPHQQLKKPTDYSMVSHGIPQPSWKSPEGEEFHYINPSQSFIHPQHAISQHHHHHVQQQQQQQHYPDHNNHHHNHHHHSNKHRGQTAYFPTKPCINSLPLMTPDLIPADNNNINISSPFHWMSSPSPLTTTSSSNQIIQPSFMTSSNSNTTSCSAATTAFSSNQLIPPTCELTPPTTTTSYKFPPITNHQQEILFPTQGIVSSPFPSPHSMIQDGRYLESASSCHSIGSFG